MTKEVISFNFPIDSKDRVHRILHRSRNFFNAVDVVRAALRVYDELLNHTLQPGCKVIVRHIERRRDFPYLLHAPFVFLDFVISPETRISSVGETEKGLPKNVFLSGEHAERLLAIKRRGSIRANSDVIRRALIAFDELTSVDTSRCIIIFRDALGNERCFNPYVPFAPDGAQSIERNDLSAQRRDTSTRREPD